jgi:hypothetical protein
MNISTETILIIGYSLTGIVFLMGVYKKLRNIFIIMVSLVACIIIAIIGFLIRSERTDMVAGNAADSFFGPLIYIITFAFLRFIYKKKYSVEPTYNRSSWYDYEEGRRQNWLDVVVHILPLLLAIVLPLLIK